MFMLSRFVYILFSSGLLLFSWVLFAEQQVTNVNAKGSLKSEQTINLQYAIAKTFQHNPALRAFDFAIKAQSGKQMQATTSASPELNLMVEDAFGSGVFDGVDNAQFTLGIAWVLEGDIRRGYVDVASAGTTSLNTQKKIKRLNAAAETARLYIVCLATQAQLGNAEKTLSLAVETVSAVKQRSQAGRAPEAELVRAQVELSRRQLEYEDIEYQLDSAIHQLAAQWGETQPAFERVEGDIFSLPVVLSFEKLKKQLEKSPEFIRLMSDKRLLQAQLKLAESQSNSAWKLDLGVRHYETSNDQALVAGISFPFGERSRNKGNIISARENLSQTQAKVDELKVRFETTLYVLSQQLQRSLHRVSTYQNSIIPQLENALKETRRAYELGRYSYLEWRSVQANLLDARSVLIEASISAYLKVIEIERLTGISMTGVAVQETINSVSEKTSNS